jgi:cyclic dehypoxanthinyl futalosine synthase
MTDAILSRAAAGERITPEEAVALYAEAPLQELGAAADAVVRRMYGDRITYNVNAHLNPTNICVVGCGFCAFAVWTEKDERAYAYSVDQLVDRATQLSELGITELHIVGGMTKEYDLPYYEELFTELKAQLPHVSLTALPARGRPRHDAGRRGRGLQRPGAQDHRRPQGPRRDVARGAP